MTEREFCHIHAAKTPRFHCNLASNRGERPCCSDSLRSAFPGPSGLCKTPSKSPGSFHASEFPRRTLLGKEGELPIQLFWEARILSLLQAGEPCPHSRYLDYVDIS